MSVRQYRTNRKDLLYDNGKPRYNIKLHIQSEMCDVTMTRSRGSYKIADAVPCNKGGDCSIDRFHYRLTNTDNQLIELYMTAYFRRIDENKNSKRNDGGGLSTLSDTIPVPSVKGEKT